MLDETDPTTTDSTTTDTPADQPANEPAEGLGDGGRKALANEREARKVAERKAREATDRLGEIEAAELRRTVSAEKGLTDAQAAFVVGADREAMEATADSLLAAFKADDGPPRTPRERLRSGAVPGVDPDDMGKVADRIARNW
jgi:hypothetical protein